MAPHHAQERTKPFLNKNKSIKLFKEKKRKQDLYKQQRESLLKQYDDIDTTKVKTFAHLPLTSETKRGLKKCNYTTPTEIQLETIALALKKRDILGAAKTGSGKTLAFVIPILERLFCEGWCKSDGLGTLVITPTRELAMQIFEVCQNVGGFHDFTIGLVIGGKDLRIERKILNVYNIVICTPGRLLQHMDENPLFSSMNLQMLILDEADRILDMGFKKDMNAILENLPTERQTLLFSATQTKSVKDLARLSLKDPAYVSVHEHSQHATPESLEQSYIVCELSQKIDFLWSFIRNHKKQKIIVFMATCKQVKYTFDVFCRMKPGMSLMALYGGIHQLKRMERYTSFCQKNHVVLFATDLAARGLDFPNVNWVIQLDCPEDTNTYIHRVGRTARYHQGGEALLVLLPSEKDSMVKQLEDRKIPINEIKVHPSKITSAQRKMVLLLTRDIALKETAQRAFKSYYKSVFLMKDKTVFDINELDKKEMREAYATSLGLQLAPRIRFIEKHNKGASIVNLKENGDDEETGVASPPKENADNCLSLKFIGADISDDDDDDKFLQRLDNSAVDAEEKLEESSSNMGLNKKVLTKAAAVKRSLKKNIKPNVIKFNESGEMIESIPKTLKTDLGNEIAEEMSKASYTVEKAMKLMDAEDKIDKDVYREIVKDKHKKQRLKLKAERRAEQEGTTPQLAERIEEAEDDDDQIDPNEMSHSESEESDDENQSDASSSRDDEDEEEMPSKKRKLAERQKYNNMEDDEMLALHFLGNS